ncbi:hypothetical protein Sjap_000094 [Stephania japonica]|uniref:Aspergillus nuclease S1 n=1 Tax=Stephania japonica TaxID=461633 RepID=A0AAP0KJ70_9MAGN
MGLFSEETAASVRSLLPDYANGNLASLCSWPDEIKKHKDMRWSAALHFADTPDFACNYEFNILTNWFTLCRYASESIELACKYAYPNATAGSTLNDDYFLSRFPVVTRRLAQGGVRLAASLNRIFGRQKLTAEA